MRNPNRYGTIVKLKNPNLRNPYAIRGFAGYDDKGRAIRPYLGYYPTRKEATIALAMYNKNPQQIDNKTITISQIFELWSAKKFEEISESTITSYKASYKHISAIENRPIAELRKMDLDSCVMNCPAGKATKKNIIILLKALYEYAMQNDIIQKDYSQYLEPPKEQAGDKKTPRQVFTKEEIQKIWDNLDIEPYADSILFLIYSGLRVGEMLALKKENFDFNSNCFQVKKSKNSTGLRMVPIATNILPLVKKRWEAATTYFYEEDTPGKKVGYDHYYRITFASIVTNLDLNPLHRPHDTRHTFATMLSVTDAKAASIKKLIGHKSYTTTLKHYTHSSIQELQKAVDLLADVDY